MARLSRRLEQLEVSRNVHISKPCSPVHALLWKQIEHFHSRSDESLHFSDAERGLQKQTRREVIGWLRSDEGWQDVESQAFLDRWEARQP